MRGMDRNARALRLRLEGLSYAEIGRQVGISAPRVQQILSPPAAIRRIVSEKAQGRCEKCGVSIARRAAVHHKGSVGLSCDQYHDLDNLALLCPGCHMTVHRVTAIQLARRSGRRSSRGRSMAESAESIWRDAVREEPRNHREAAWPALLLRDPWVKGKHLAGTADAILARLRDMVATDGNQACVARRLGVTPQYLSAVLAGKKGLGDKIPRALGYTEVVRYEEAPNPSVEKAR